MSSKNRSLIPGVDLFEIIPRVMVGSYPSNKQSSQDDSCDLIKICHFLSKTYEKSLIVNLVAEKEPYKVNSKSIEIKHVFWKDNHVIAISEFVQLVHFVMAFLKSDEHGIFIHCKHGKGRTGTLVCALLILIKNMDVEEANNLFAKRRTLYNTGVKQKSQIRLLNYWKHLVDNRIPVHCQLTARGWRLTKLSLGSDENTSKAFSVRLACNEPYSTSKSLDYNDIGILCVNKEYNPNIHLADDICLEITYKCFMVKVYATCCFNCQMEMILQKNLSNKTGDNNRYLQFLFKDLDGVKGTQFKGKQYFQSVNLTLTEI